MVANLDQNPHKRPIISPWMPALLRAGCMWLLKPHLPDDPPNDSEDQTERWLLDVESCPVICKGTPNPSKVHIVLQPEKHDFDLVSGILVLDVRSSKEHLHSMGIPQWPISECDDPYPVFSHMPPRTVRKRLAGNVSW